MTFSLFIRHRGIRVGYCKNSADGFLPWDFTQDIQPADELYYELDSYRVPLFPRSRWYVAKKEEIVEEQTILSAHKGFLQIKQALVDLQLTEVDDRTPFLFEQRQAPHKRIAQLYHPGTHTNFFTYRLLQGDVHEVRRIAGQPKGHLMSGPEKGSSLKFMEEHRNFYTPEEVIREMQMVVADNSAWLRQYDVKASPENIRKLLIFRANKEIRRGNWLADAPKFTESVMRFIKAGASVEQLLFFHRNQIKVGNDFMPSRDAELLSESQIRSMLSLPFNLMKELCSGQGMRYTGAE